MITYLLIMIVQSFFLGIVVVIKGFIPSVSFEALTENNGFMFAVSLVDKVIGWSFLINSLSTAVLIIAIIKMVKLAIGIMSKG